ncbi:hypothetical protein [Microbispora bryophytorum]|nr:hypothetical protein [Microbispora bryophytorum]MBD3141219.1 hypothetical protein [Microbispora bryophytorum]TQS04588.1 hypothetical protein FLX07_20905 [Microbispora bryophytorum]
MSTAAGGRAPAPEGWHEAPPPYIACEPGAMAGGPPGGEALAALAVAGSAGSAGDGGDGGNVGGGQ